MTMTFHRTAWTIALSAAAITGVFATWGRTARACSPRPDSDWYPEHLVPATGATGVPTDVHVRVQLWRNTGLWGASGSPETFDATAFELRCDGVPVPGVWRTSEGGPLFSMTPLLRDGDGWRSRSACPGGCDPGGVQTLQAEHTPAGVLPADADCQVVLLRSCTEPGCTVPTSNGYPWVVLDFRTGASPPPGALELGAPQLTPVLYRHRNGTCAWVGPLPGSCESCVEGDAEDRRAIRITYPDSLSGTGEHVLHVTVAGSVEDLASATPQDLWLVGLSGAEANQVAIPVESERAVTQCVQSWVSDSRGRVTVASEPECFDPTVFPWIRSELGCATGGIGGAWLLLVGVLCFLLWRRSGRR